MKHIAVVEDEALMREELADMLRRAGYVVTEVTDFADVTGQLLTLTPDLVLLDFSGSEDNFAVSDEDINIGISVRKGNTVLKEALDSVLSTMTAEDFNAIMAQATAIQPIE